MKAFTKWIFTSAVVGFYVGCSPVEFGLDTTACEADGCVVENGEYSFNYTATAGYGKVDILIVNDNSASMSFEQARLAPRFANFINDLDARNIDYRIAMTTTDVTNSRGGKLIDFGGTYFLTPKNTSRHEMFNRTIQRAETLSCEKFIADWIRTYGKSSINHPTYASEYAKNCPSGDERGTYAANLVMQNNPHNFIRTQAHLAIIFISDEDVRSGLWNQSGYQLESLDQPASLINNVKNKYGVEKYNSLSVHAIVVKDNTCLAEQNNQALDGLNETRGLVSGSIGNLYMAITEQGWGKSADICSTNYPNQLGQIRANITDSIKDIMLSCSNPKNLVVTVSGANVSYTLNGKTLILNQALTNGTSIHLSYKCSSLN